MRTPLAPMSTNKVTNSKRSTSTKPSTFNIEGLKFSELKEEYLKLDNKFTKLHGKYLELQDAHTVLNQLLREKTKSYHDWMNHANELNELCQKRQRIIKKLGIKLKASAAAVSGPFEGYDSSDTSVWPASMQQVAESERFEGRPSHVPEGTPSIRPPTIVEVADCKPAKSDFMGLMTMDEESRASQRDETPDSELYNTTEDDDANILPPLAQIEISGPKDVVVKNESSSDPPVIVSERCLRKRKLGDDERKKTPTLAKIKLEDSSDPLVIGEQRRFVPDEDIDFDAEGGRVETPRKRSRTRPASEEVLASKPANLHNENSRLRSRGGEIHILNSAAKPNHVPITPTDHHTAAPLPETENHSSLLTPSDRNSILRHRPEAHYVAKQKASPLYNGIASLLEDGDHDEESISTIKRKSKAGRLQGLLGTPLPEREVISISANVRQGHFPISKPSTTQVPQRRELPFDKNSPREPLALIRPHYNTELSSRNEGSATKNAKRASDKRVANEVIDGHKRLRERPKSELGIGDFRINPNANNGLDYAFTDVVRNKDERAGLAGCVQEGCCGQTFRLQARVARDHTSSSDFQALLERYLGDEAWKLGTMSKPEKEELWLEAKTQELANEDGRHRHRFHRAPSPAGFWRPDFPNTQEEQKDKEEAARMTRKIIDERYREAMRPGGRWLFRDE